jgi:hypothetical protein
MFCFFTSTKAHRSWRCTCKNFIEIFDNLKYVFLVDTPGGRIKFPISWRTKYLSMFLIFLQPLIYWVGDLYFVFLFCLNELKFCCGAIESWPQIIIKPDAQQVSSIDMHPIQPWWVILYVIHIVATYNYFIHHLFQTIINMSYAGSWQRIK